MKIYESHFTVPTTQPVFNISNTIQHTSNHHCPSYPIHLLTIAPLLWSPIHFILLNNSTWTQIPFECSVVHCYMYVHVHVIVASHAYCPRFKIRQVLQDSVTVASDGAYMHSYAAFKNVNQSFLRRETIRFTNQKYN